MILVKMYTLHLKKGFGNDMQMVVILSRPQCVKHDIALDRYHYSHISNKYV